MRKAFAFLLIFLFSSILSAQTFSIEATDPREKAAVNPSNNIVFPQVANGVAGNLRIITSIVLTNTLEDTVTVDLVFYQSDGFRLVVGIGDSVTGESVGPGSSFTVTIFPFQTVFLETDGLGALQVGWVNARSPKGRLIGGVAAYQIYGVNTEELITIVGVGASAATPAFTIPVFRDVSLNSATAIAIANSSDNTANMRAILFNNAGGVLDKTFFLGPKQHMARYLNELFPEMGERFFGTLHVFRVDSQGNAVGIRDIHPVALRQSKGVLSSIPATNLIPIR